MKGEDVNSLQPKELIAIEEALQNGQTNLREKMVTLGFQNSELPLLQLAVVALLFCGVLLSLMFVLSPCCRWTTGRCTGGLYGP